jgi:hypothetical protein
MALPVPAFLAESVAEICDIYAIRAAGGLKLLDRLKERREEGLAVHKRPPEGKVPFRNKVLKG